MGKVIENRYEIMALIQAKMCNPNGDPDLNNYPRVDYETNYGIISDVAFKSKIRNYILEAYEEKDGHKILIKKNNSINRDIAESVILTKETEKSKKGNRLNLNEAEKYMCENYWDVRTFGGVLSTGLNAGQIKGPVQIGMALSVEPVEPTLMTITRKCYTEGQYSTLEEYDANDAKIPDDKKRTFGEKTYVPYGLYVMHMSISANLAKKVGFTEDDLKILLEAVVQMYNEDSSSKMGMTVLTPIIIFKHIGTDSDLEQRKRECLLGCAPAYKLFELLEINRKPDVEIARNYTDYNINLNLSKLPIGISCGLKKSAFNNIDWVKDNKDINLSSI